MKFTKEQLKWFNQYKTVQMSGRFNMILEAPQAMQVAGLTQEQYKFVINNYQALYDQANEQD